ncbi:MAG: hypothetical protein QXF56_00265 [Candidatus Micrarchaeia archaeon]
MRKLAAGEWLKGLLERFNAGDASSFHTSVFENAFEGVKARFRELGESRKK